MSRSERQGPFRAPSIRRGSNPHQFILWHGTCNFRWKSRNGPSVFDDGPSAKEGLEVSGLGSQVLHVVEDMGLESIIQVVNDERRVAVRIKEVSMEEKASRMESVYMEKRIFEPPKEFIENAYINSMDEYKKMWERSINDPQAFWGEMAEENLDWFKKWDGPVEEYSFKDDIYLRYFAGGKLNVTYNCLDRHLKTWRKNKAALIWQGEPLDEAVTYTYQQLHREVCKFANVLRGFGIKKGDRVAIYLPMLMELPVAMLACARMLARGSAPYTVSYLEVSVRKP